MFILIFVTLVVTVTITLFCSNSTSHDQSIVTGNLTHVYPIKLTEKLSIANRITWSYIFSGQVSNIAMVKLKLKLKLKPKRISPHKAAQLKGKLNA